MLIRITEPGKPAFRLRKGEEGISVFDSDSVEPPLVEEEVAEAFRSGSETVTLPGSVAVTARKNPLVPTGAFFNNTSYADRYRILCQRMVLERHYNAATLLMAERATLGTYREPSADLRIETFLKSLFGHLIGCL